MADQPTQGNMKDPRTDRPLPVQTQAKDPTQDKVQGEGDYEAARRYRAEVADYMNHADIDATAQAAKPQSSAQEREMLQAEDSGKARSKGDDPKDPAAMYPGRKAPDVSDDDQA